MGNTAETQHGALVIWTDIDPVAEADFNRWYDDQHLEERVGVPGFINGRRYVALRETDGAQLANAKYLAWYEVDTPDVLGSAAYGERQANPTEWTARIMPSFRNVTRVTCARIAKSGKGIGAVSTTISFEAPETGADALATWLSAQPARLTDYDGVIAAQALRPSNADAAQGTTEAVLRAAHENPPVWCLMLEATSLAAVEAALADSGIAAEISTHIGGPVETAHYAMMLARGDLS